MEEDKEKYKVVNKYLSLWNTTIDIVLWFSLLIAMSTDDVDKSIMFLLFIIYRLLYDRLPKNTQSPN